MRIRKILLDLDDTLVDFTMTALEYVGCNVKGPRDFGAFDPAWKFDIIKAYNSLNPEWKFSLGRFWDQFDCTFWANLPKSEEFDLLFKAVLNIVGEDGILICTSPICGPKISLHATTECLAGKFLWIKKHLPEYLHRSFSMGPRKHFLASPETLLIDDCDGNVEKFHAAGGHAILMPRPWNENHRENSLVYLSREFKRFFG